MDRKQLEAELLAIPNVRAVNVRHAMAEEIAARIEAGWDPAIASTDWIIISAWAESEKLGKPILAEHWVSLAMLDDRYMPAGTVAKLILRQLGNIEANYT